MTTYYIDPENGSDVNAGTSWALAWKTSKLGATAARIAPGDIIKVAKSPDPTPLGNATWNNMTKTVTLATACTATVASCDAIWSIAGISYVTPTINTTIRKSGTGCASLVITATFTTGKVAFQALTEVDLSGYQQLSFWFNSNLAIATGVLKLCLCSDVAGETIVDEFFIPALETAQISVWKAYTIDKGANLGASIKSISLWAISDPGAATFYLDNIIAVKNKTSDTSLSLTSLISKNSLATGGTEAWFPIQSIEGVTVMLDNGVGMYAATVTARGYYGTGGVAAAYKRQPFILDMSTEWDIMDSGTAGSLIQFQGGYNTGTDAQEGETFLSVGSGIGTGIDLTSINYVLLNKLNMVRASSGITLSTTTYCQVTAHTLCGNTANGLFLNIGCFFNTCNIACVVNNQAIGVYVLGTTSGCFGNEISVGAVNNNVSDGWVFSALSSYNRCSGAISANNGGDGLSFVNSYGNYVKIADIKDSAAYGISFMTNSQRNTVEAVTTDNTTAAILSDTICRNFLKNSTLNETTKVAGLLSYGDSQVSSTFEDGSATVNRVYTEGGLIQSQTAVRHTASGIAWQLMPTAASRKEARPLVLSLAKIAVYADLEVTISVYMQKDNAAITGRLICRKWQLAGITSDVIATKNATTGAWELLTIAFTPTETGVVEIEVEAWGGTAYSVYVDDVTVAQS